MEKAIVLGVKISKHNKNSAAEIAAGLLSENKTTFAVTLNPEIILEAMTDEEYFYILNRSNLALLDGIGLKIAVWLSGQNIKRITGADLTAELLKQAENSGAKVAIVCRHDGLSTADEIISAVSKKYPSLIFKVAAIDRNLPLPRYKDITTFQPKIVFAALGAPWQEKFLFYNLKNWPSVKIGIGVGGSFDFLTGKISRAPNAMRYLGLEWLWRLIKQPLARTRRIGRAVFVFPCKFLAWRLILPHLYRSNVACLLYKKENDKFKILIVERTHEKDHWQLPQGGINRGESVINAGVRELSEELNTYQIKAVKSYPKLHHYEFGDSQSKYNVKARQASGYKGQKQNLLIAEFIGQDDDIRVNAYEHTAWKWVDSEQLLDSIYPVRRGATAKFLEKFYETVN